MSRTPVAKCEGCWRDTDRVSYCIGCGLTLCPGCRGDDLITCDGCGGSELRHRRKVVALARRASAVLDEAAREAEALAGRAAEHARWSRPAASDAYEPAFVDTLQLDFALTAATGEAAELAGAYAVPSLPPRSRRRADEVHAASERYRGARAAAREAIDAIASSTSNAVSAARRQTLVRRAMALLVLLAAAVGAMPVLERLF